MKTTDKVVTTWMLIVTTTSSVSATWLHGFLLGQSLDVLRTMLVLGFGMAIGTISGILSAIALAPYVDDDDD